MYRDELLEALVDQAKLKNEWVHGRPGKTENQWLHGVAISIYIKCNRRRRS